MNVAEICPVSRRSLPKPIHILPESTHAPWGSQALLSIFWPNPERPRTLSRSGLHLIVKTAVSSANYSILAQNHTEVMDPDNSPSISMWPYLLDSLQTARLNTLSVYTDRGRSKEQMRLLYMNREALALWREMGRCGLVIGESHRPPPGAVLSFGKPFFS